MFESFNQSLEKLDDLTLNFNAAGLLTMNITIAFVMFGIALGMKKEHFQNIVQDPKPVLIGVISQFILMPAMTFLLVVIAKFPVSISLGMILVAACPGGNVSNFMTSLAKGNVALSVSLTAIADLASILMTPFSFYFWSELYFETLPIEKGLIHIEFLDVLKTIVLIIGIPLVLGLWFQRKFPKVTEKIYKPMKIISFLAFLGFIAGAILANDDYFIKYFIFLFPIVFVHNLLALATGFSFSSLFRLKKMNVKTITIETGIQNSGLALVLLFSPAIQEKIGGLGGIAFIAAMWGIWHIASGLIISTLWSKRKDPDEKIVVAKE